MTIQCVLFDLDGTLLPMDTDAFARAYFRLLTEKMLPYGYEPDELLRGLDLGIAAMRNNDGSRPNAEVFWDRFVEVVGKRALNGRALFDLFYAVDFQRLSENCGHTPRARETVELCHALGYRVAVATQPVFPLAAMESRLRWAGVEPSAVALVTAYETSAFCKPNPGYYRAVAERLGVRPEECAMVGNDVGEDMSAENLGMKTFLLTDCLINRNGADLRRWANGGYDQLQIWLRTLKEL